jgi:hypothetical protein
MAVVATDPAAGWELHEVEAEDDKATAKFEDGDDGEWLVSAVGSGSSISCASQQEPD